MNHKIRLTLSCTWFMFLYYNHVFRHVLYPFFRIRISKANIGSDTAGKEGPLEHNLRINLSFYSTDFEADVQCFCVV